MALELDDRQRAMLQEMGVRVWLPGTAFALDRGELPRAAPANERATAASMAATPAPVPAAVPRPAVASASREAPVAVPVAAARASQPLGVDQLGWSALAQAASDCQACGLCAGRKYSTLQAPVTPGQADWFFVGDPPDEDEDQAGHAFAGQAGQLLDNMFKAMGARRGDVGRGGAYATNIVKCRPPVARLPQPEEVAQCASYLQRELALVRPKVIVAMGRLATAHLLSEHPEALSLPLGKQRGTVYRYQGIPVVVSYAPKILLRASADKAKAWADLCLALDVRDGLV